MAQNDVVMSFKFFAVQYGARLVAAFDSIPASKYSFRPTPAQQSIGFIAQHLEAANYGLCERLGVARGNRSPQDAAPDTVKAAWPKDTLVTRLRASLAFCDSAVSKLIDSQLNQPIAYGPPGSNLKAVPSRTLLGFVTDLAEHYSQLASYMRLIGVTRRPRCRRSSARPLICPWQLSRSMSAATTSRRAPFKARPVCDSTSHCAAAPFTSRRPTNPRRGFGPRARTISSSRRPTSR